MKTLSVVIPVYNEVENVPLMAARIHEALAGMDYEVIFVDDGSKDGTVKAVRQLDDSRIKLVEFMRNFGQSSAMMAGIQAAEGEWIATLDGDLQNDPIDIPDMLRRAREEDWDMVAGVRANRKDGFLLRKLPSRIANRIIQRSTGVRIKDYGCSLKVMRAQVAKQIGIYGELHRFIPVLIALQGGRITQMDVRHHPRQFGESKYGLGRTFRVMADLLLMLFMLRYQQRPIHLFGTWGLLIFVIGVLINLFMFGMKLAGADIWGKPLLLLGIFLTLGGIQLITFGIMFEIQNRTYYESQGKRPYTIRNIFVGKDKVKSDS
ncbi:MAG: glycosyltransferase family 2 protein [Bacteroidota bacterium]